MLLFEKILTLNQTALFASLPTDDLQRLAEITRIEDAAAGSTLFARGDVGEQLFIIVSGSVDVIGTENAPPLATLAAGDVLGEMALFDGETRSATARCREASRFLILDRADFDELLLACPSVSIRLLQTLAARLRQLLAARRERVD